MLGDRLALVVQRDEEQRGDQAFLVLEVVVDRALLPAGEAWLARGTRVVAGRRTLTLYRIGGILFTPVPVWLDQTGATAAVIDDWFELLGDRLRPLLPRLQAAQSAAGQAWSADLARRLTHRPAGALMVRHARLFDPRELAVRDDMRVPVRGEHVVRVEPDDTAAPPPATEVIDAAGRFLMPGLWDVHQPRPPTCASTCASRPRPRWTGTPTTATNRSRSTRPEPARFHCAQPPGRHGVDRR